MGHYVRILHSVHFIWDQTGGLKLSLTTERFISKTQLSKCMKDLDTVSSLCLCVSVCFTNYELTCSYKNNK